jgi:outer membrane protein TolC
MIVLMVSSLISVPAFAGGVFTVKDALTAAVENNLGIQAAGFAVKSKEAGIEQFKAEYDPYVAASAGAENFVSPNSYSVYDEDFQRRNDFTGGVSLVKKHETGFTAGVTLNSSRLSNNDDYEELDPAYETSVEFDINVPLMKNYGKETGTAGIRTAENEFLRSGFDYLSSALDASVGAETAFCAYQRALSVLEYRKESRELAIKLLEANKKKFEAGVIPVTEVQEAETAVASRDEKVIAAGQDVESALNNLENIINISIPESSAIPRLAEIDGFAAGIEDSLKTARRSRPDLLKQKLVLENSDIQLKYLKNQELPILDLNASLGVNGLSGREAEDNRFKGSYADSYGSMAEGDGYSWYVGVNFKYPFGNRYAVSKSSSARSEKMRQLVMMKKLDSDALTEIKNALVLINGSRERFDVAGRFQRLAETTLAQETRRMEEGLSDTFRILDFQDDVIEAKIRALNALYDYNRGLALLHRAEGTSLSRYGIHFRYADDSVM